MEVHLVLEQGGAEAFAIHIPLRDYIKSMFCHIWLMYRVFLKTGLKYENRQKLLHYKDWSIFNNLLKEKGGEVEMWAAQKCTDQVSATFCNRGWSPRQNEHERPLTAPALCACYTTLNGEFRLRY